MLVVRSEAKTHSIDLNEHMSLILTGWVQEINSTLCPESGYKIWRTFFFFDKIKDVWISTGASTSYARVIV